MTHRYESSYWIARDALSKAISAADEMPEDAWRAASVARWYREVAEFELLWKNNVEASREALASSGRVVNGFLTTVTESGNDFRKIMHGWDIADAILSLLAAQCFEQAKTLSTLALNDKRAMGATKDDFDGLFLPALARTALELEVSDDEWCAFRVATKSENNLLGFYTGLHGIYDRDATRIDTGLYQMELGHTKNRRNRYGTRYAGNILFPETAYYNLTRHFGITMALGFEAVYLAEELLID